MGGTRAHARARTSLPHLRKQKQVEIPQLLPWLPEWNILGRVDAAELVPDLSQISELIISVDIRH